MGKRIRKQQADVVAAFANRLRQIRNQRGLSQIKLAAKAGVNLSYLNKLERAEATPGLDLIARLAAALGVTLSELFEPLSESKEQLPALRQQTREHLDEAVRKAGRHELEMMAVLGSVLASAFSRNR